MTPEQKVMVQNSFQKVVPIADTAAELFYNRLFELDPALKPLFKGDIKEQGRKLMKMIGMAVTGLDELSTLIPVVQGLGKRHITYGVKDEDYNTVGEALLWTLEKGLGDDFTPEVKQAWTDVYVVLASVMKEGAAVSV
jgi:hemoglobin-like flavoprotein